jgi:hypothetical protein
MDEKRRFRFRLALALGFTVAELEAKMGNDELNEWYEYCSLEPFGEERADLRAATICLAIAQVNGVKNAKLSDFLLKFDKKHDEDDLDRRLFAAFTKV